LNVFAGQNGSGKTSLLEAIHLLGYASSFRLHEKQGLVNIDSERLLIGGTVESDAACPTRIGLEIGRNGRVAQMQVNGRRISKASDLSRFMPITLIAPEDHRIFELGPKYRRRFLDWGVFHVEPSYIDGWREYHHVLRQRNAAIKRNENIAVWDPLLAQCANVLTTYRETYLVCLSKELQTLLANRDWFNKVQLRLKAGWPPDREFLEHLENQRASDLAVRTTHSGPHKADVVIEVDGRPARTFLSRGQTKLLICLLRTAQAILMSKRKGTSGLVLADDLAAELDGLTRARVLEMLYNSGLQLFLTATSTNDFSLERLTDVRVFHVEHGRVEPILPKSE
jgi:DNA replication and repair protein RecF